jgi:hypothetical protein
VAARWPQNRRTIIAADNPYLQTDGTAARRSDPRIGEKSHKCARADGRGRRRPGERNDQAPRPFAHRASWFPVRAERRNERARELADHVVVLSHGEVALARRADEVTLSEIEEAYKLNAAEVAAQ